MWFARMMTWRMYACIGLLLKVGLMTFLHSDVGKGGGSDAQSFAVVGGFRRDVKGDPAVWTVERDRTHLL
jgi:hypothetical protein